MPTMDPNLPTKRWSTVDIRTDDPLQAPPLPRSTSTFSLISDMIRRESGAENDADMRIDDLFQPTDNDHLLPRGQTQDTSISEQTVCGNSKQSNMGGELENDKAIDSKGSALNGRKPNVHRYSNDGSWATSATSVTSMTYNESVLADAEQHMRAAIKYKIKSLLRHNGIRVSRKIQRELRNILHNNGGNLTMATLTALRDHLLAYNVEFEQTTQSMAKNYIAKANSDADKILNLARRPSIVKDEPWTPGPRPIYEPLEESQVETGVKRGQPRATVHDSFGYRRSATPEANVKHSRDRAKSDSKNEPTAKLGFFERLLKSDKSKADVPSSADLQRDASDSVLQATAASKLKKSRGSKSKNKANSTDVKNPTSGFFFRKTKKNEEIELNTFAPQQAAHTESGAENEEPTAFVQMSNGFTLIVPASILVNTHRTEKQIRRDNARFGPVDTQKELIRINGAEPVLITEGPFCNLRREVRRLKRLERAKKVAAADADRSDVASVSKMWKYKPEEESQKKQKVKTKNGQADKDKMVAVEMEDGFTLTVPASLLVDTERTKKQIRKDNKEFGPPHAQREWIKVDDGAVLLIKEGAVCRLRRAACRHWREEEQQGRLAEEEAEKELREIQKEKARQKAKRMKFQVQEDGTYYMEPAKDDDADGINVMFPPKRAMTVNVIWNNLKESAKDAAEPYSNF